MKRVSVAILALAATVATAPAWAAMVNYTATLNGASQVPAKTTAGTGAMEATLDTSTKMLNYTVTYSGLSGPATAAHIHAPAAVGANAGVAIGFPLPVTSPIKGSVPVTDDQIKAMDAGMTYVNVHTAANTGGEIRGQIIKK